MEMRSFSTSYGDMTPFEALVTGVGPVETTYTLTSRLARGIGHLQAVIHFGVAGAYIHSDGNGPGMLDICLAEEEVLGDLGICHRDRIEPFVAPELAVADRFPLDIQLLNRARRILEALNISCWKGRFITVNCASGTRKRGDILVRQFQGLCENMEGAALARVCSAFDLPCLELRCISNFVEDRNVGRWKLREACRRAGETAALVAKHLHEQNHSKSK